MEPIPIRPITLKSPPPAAATTATPPPSPPPISTPSGVSRAVKNSELVKELEKAIKWATKGIQAFGKPIKGTAEKPTISDIPEERKQAIQKTVGEAIDLIVAKCKELQTKFSTQVRVFDDDIVQNLGKSLVEEIDNAASTVATDRSPTLKSDVYRFFSQNGETREIDNFVDKLHQYSSDLKKSESLRGWIGEQITRQFSSLGVFEGAYIDDTSAEKNFKDIADRLHQSLAHAAKTGEWSRFEAKVGSTGEAAWMPDGKYRNKFNGINFNSGFYDALKSYFTEEFPEADSRTYATQPGYKLLLQALAQFGETDKTNDNVVTQARIKRIRDEIKENIDALVAYGLKIPNPETRLRLANDAFSSTSLWYDSKAKSMNENVLNQLTALVTKNAGSFGPDAAKWLMDTILHTKIEDPDVAIITAKSKLIDALKNMSFGEADEEP